MSRTRGGLRPWGMTTNRLVLHEHPFAAYWVAADRTGRARAPVQRHIVPTRRRAANWRNLAARQDPVLVDETAGMVLPESTTIIEYLDGPAGGDVSLVPADAAGALQARHGSLPRPVHREPDAEDRRRHPAARGLRGPRGRRRGPSHPRHRLPGPQTPNSHGNPGPRARRSPWPTARRHLRSSTRAPSTAGTRRRSPTSPATTASSCTDRRWRG